jgi:hypothetical protein
MAASPALRRLRQLARHTPAPLPCAAEQAASAVGGPPLLSAEQHESFNSEGFLNAGRIFSEAEIKGLSDELDRVLAIGAEGQHGAVSFTPFSSSEKPVIQIVNMWEASPAFASICSHPSVMRIVRQLIRREQQIGGSGGSLEPPGPLLEPPGPLLTHLHTVYIAYSECLPTHLNPLAERTCFSQADRLGRHPRVARPDAVQAPLPRGNHGLAPGFARVADHSAQPDALGVASLGRRLGSK